MNVLSNERLYQLLNKPRLQMDKILFFAVLIAALIFLSACTYQQDPGDTFSRVAYPGEMTLYYSKKPDNPEDPVKVLANGKEFHVYGKAVWPSVQSMFLLETSLIKEGESVLDIGTGSGIQAIFAASKARHVVATDIGKDAIKSTRINVKRFGLQDKIDVRFGDLFEPVKPGEKFDVIINNINYPEAEENSDDPLWQVHERFFKEVSAYLKQGGRIIYESGFLFNFLRIQSMVEKNGLQIMQMKMQTSIVFKKEMMVYVVKRKAF